MIVLILSMLASGLCDAEHQRPDGTWSPIYTVDATVVRLPYSTTVSLFFGDGQTAAIDVGYLGRSVPTRGEDEHGQTWRVTCPSAFGRPSRQPPPQSSVVPRTLAAPVGPAGARLEARRLQRERYRENSEMIQRGNQQMIDGLERAAQMQAATQAAGPSAPVYGQPHPESQDEMLLAVAGVTCVSVGVLAVGAVAVGALFFGLAAAR